MENLKKEISEFFDLSGADIIYNLSDLMHIVQTRNEEIMELKKIRKEINEAETEEGKNFLTKHLFNTIDCAEVFNSWYIADLRHSVNQTNKLLTELLVYNAQQKPD